MSLGNVLVSATTLVLAGQGDKEGSNSPPDGSLVEARWRWRGGHTRRGDLRDRDVRQALHRKVLIEHHGDPDTLVLDELGLRHGAGRVDVAVVNGEIHGFEIKSDADTLERLPAQVALYGAVLDKATLVVGEKHLACALGHLPDWWGVRVAVAGPRGAVHFRTDRQPRRNQQIDPVALAELLWRPEAVEILTDLDAPSALLRKPRAELYSYLATVVPLDELRSLIRLRLKARERWRGQRPLASGVGSSTPIPT